MYIYKYKYIGLMCCSYALAIMAAASGLAKTILDASRSSNVRGLGSVDESAAALEKRSKRLNLETDS